jgi:putative membrane protein
MTQRSSDRLKALLLIMTAIFLTEKLVSGKLFYYIGPRFSWLAIVAVALLIILAGAYDLVGRKADADAHDGHDHDHERPSVWPLVIVAVPLVLGVVIPARPLGATAVETRGMTTDVALNSGSDTSTLTIIPSERNLLDWVRAINESSDPASLDGQEVDVVGFVYRDPRFAEDQFMVGRFTLTCCVADALAIGLVVQSTEAEALQADTWVRIKGKFQAGDAAGQAMPILVADEIVRVEEPEQPYLYP